MPQLTSSVPTSTAYIDWLFRVSHPYKLCAYSALFLMLTACSGFAGDWPNLAEPFPDPKERERVIEHANPVAPTRAPTESPLTSSDAVKLLKAIQTQFAKDTSAYKGAKAHFAAAMGEDKTDYWNEAQLALTRLSHTASRLDAILNADTIKSSDVWMRVLRLKKEQDTYLVKERRLLAGIKP